MSRQWSWSRTKWKVLWWYLGGDSDGWRRTQRCSLEQGWTKSLQIKCMAGGTRARNEASFGGIASLRLDYLPPRFASPRRTFQNLASPRLASSNFRIASLRLASDLRDQVTFTKFRVFFISFDSMLCWYSRHLISRSSGIAFINFRCQKKLENYYFDRIV